MIDLFRRVRNRTSDLAKPISIEALGLQSAVFASPTKWHLAHTTWFFEEFILSKFLEGYKPFDPEFGFLFNSYYDSIGQRQSRQERGMLSHPPAEKVWEYRQSVDESMQTLLQNLTLEEPLRKLIEIGVHHEQQHQELLMTDIKHTLGTQTLRPAYGQTVSEDCVAGNPDWIHLAGDVAQIGALDSGTFSFDNERPRHTTYVNETEMATNLVSNAEFMEFMNDSGYADHRHWLMDGWSWVNEHDIRGPLYWFKQDGEWYTYTLNGVEAVDPLQAVCHVSYYEANAFAQWSGRLLPTEAQREVAFDRIPVAGRWEWTNSAYLPYPGYRQPPGAVGEYNGKFMINQMVLKGGSVVTAEGHTRPTYRNFFYPDQRWQYTGIRLCK